jgi:hypothetical protein
VVVDRRHPGALRGRKHGSHRATRACAVSSSALVGTNVRLSTFRRSTGRFRAVTLETAIAAARVRKDLAPARISRSCRTRNATRRDVDTFEIDGHLVDRSGATRPTFVVLVDAPARVGQGFDWTWQDPAMMGEDAGLVNCTSRQRSSRRTGTALQPDGSYLSSSSATRC